MSAHLYHQDYLAAEDVECYFCTNKGHKLNFFQVDIDEPGNTKYVCHECYHKGMIG